jgi:hypothetical protein
VAAELELDELRLAYDAAVARAERMSREVGILTAILLEVSDGRLAPPTWDRIFERKRQLYEETPQVDREAETKPDLRTA